MNKILENLMTFKNNPHASYAIYGAAAIEVLKVWLPAHAAQLADTQKILTWYGILAATTSGTPPPPPPGENPTAVKIKTILPILLLCALASFLFAGCATNDHNRRVVHGAGSFTKVGVGENMATGLYELGILHGQTTFTIVPILFATNAVTGHVYVVVPDVADSYETTGANSIFGRGGITSTFATGTNGVGSLLGGAHYPVNDKAQISPGLNAALPK